jgi:hypothetical protein
VAAMELATILRATVSLTCLVGTLVAVLTAWVKLEETPEQNIERVAKEQGRCGVGQFECEKQLKYFETCSALNPNDADFCEEVVLDGNAATCTGAGGGNKCAHNARPGVRAGPPLCIPDDLVRNNYYDCIGTVEACTAVDEDIAADVAKCAAVVLDGNPATCTSAGSCRYWGQDVVSDFSDEKCASFWLLSRVATIAVMANRLTCAVRLSVANSVGVADVPPGRCDRDHWWGVARIQLLQID